MKRTLKVMFKARRKEWAIPIPLSRDGHVNIASLSLSKQVFTLEGQPMANGGIPGRVRIL